MDIELMNTWKCQRKFNPKRHKIEISIGVHIQFTQQNLWALFILVSFHVGDESKMWKFLEFCWSVSNSKDMSVSEGQYNPWTIFDFRNCTGFAQLSMHGFPPLHLFAFSFSCVSQITKLMRLNPNWTVYLHTTKHVLGANPWWDPLYICWD